MIDSILNIALLSAPLLLASFGALVSEYSGRMAVFIDGIINLSAFLCYAFTIFTHSSILGAILSVITCTLFIFVSFRAVEYFNANPFLASLGLNLLTNALVSCFSSSLFKTRGVLFSSDFVFQAFQTRLITFIFSLILLLIGIIFLFKTKIGLYIRITGSDSDVLKDRGINVNQMRILSWCIATIYATVAGCFLSFRLSSFVPNISSGKGWLALAAVFLGRKTCGGIIIATLIMSTGEYFAANLQNIFPTISSPLLISMPYIISLILILLIPTKSKA